SERRQRSGEDLVRLRWELLDSSARSRDGLGAAALLEGARHAVQRFWGRREPDPRRDLEHEGPATMPGERRAAFAGREPNPFFDAHAVERAPGDLHRFMCASATAGRSGAAAARER